MTENKNYDDSQRPVAERIPLKLKDEKRSKEESVNTKNIKKEIPLYYCAKYSSNSLKNSFEFTKAKTKSRELDKRYDIYGNLIEHRGKQKISFIDCVSKNSFFEVIKIDNYKEYNKVEEVTPNNGNGCCLII